MRDQSDLIAVHVATIRDLTVDLEMLEANSRFRSIRETIIAKYGMLPDNMDATYLAIQEFLRNYVQLDQFPHQTPGTTGPGNITQVQVEVAINDTRESKDGAH
jgi:hypothetical protein